MAFALYREYSIENIMVLTGIFTFIGFGTTNAIVVHLIKKLGLKKSILIGFVGFCVYEFTILLSILLRQS